MSQRVAIAALLGVLVGTGSAFAEPADIYLECLLDFERYAESIWHDAESPARSGYFGDGASDGNGGIRGTCGIALAYAVLICEQPGSPVRARRLQRLRATLNYAANTHQTGPDRCIDGKQWGFSWQSSLWTGSMALAAVLVEEDLPRELVIACQRVSCFPANSKSVKTT